jgi:pyridoxine 5-phosphate synthase
MTALSVNLNKLALLRNSRGRNYPDLLEFATRFIALGAHGITIHPRPDERHIRRRDAYELAELLRDYPWVEFNIEGYPSAAFLQLVADIRPHQCTLVPDAETQLTSDHGWDCQQQQSFLEPVIGGLRALGVRVAVFLDPQPQQASYAAAVGADRIELYTEAFARAFATAEQDAVLERYRVTAASAQALGMGVNAGHDLNLQNLATFLQIPGILEVSIGHALTVECIEQGLVPVIGRYLEICAGQHTAAQ